MASEHEILDAMHRYGGSFVKALGEAARCADGRNLHRLKIAFPDYWQEYDEVAELAAKRATHPLAARGSAHDGE